MLSPQPESLQYLVDVRYIQILRISALISMVAMLALTAVAIQGVRRSKQDSLCLTPTIVETAAKTIYCISALAYIASYQR